MVSKKTKKAFKVSYTYTDRVLRACTQIQKAQRKNAIHVLSIRSQIKKNADEDNDELGQHWSTYVGSAIRKLEGQGFLKPCQSPSGSVTLTAEGMQAIAAARLSLADEIGTDSDDLVMHQATRNPATSAPHGRRRGHFSRKRLKDNDEFTGMSYKAKRQRLSSASPLTFRRPANQSKSPENDARDPLDDSPLSGNNHNDNDIQYDDDETEVDETIEERQEVERIDEEESIEQLVLTQTQSPPESPSMRAGVPIRLSSPGDNIPTSLTRSLQNAVSSARSITTSMAPQIQPISQNSDQAEEQSPILNVFETTHRNLPNGSLVRQGNETNLQDQDDAVVPGEVLRAETPVRLAKVRHDITNRVPSIDALETRLMQLRTTNTENQRRIMHYDQQFSAMLETLAELQEGSSRRASDLERMTEQLVALTDAKENLEASYSLRLEGLDQDAQERDRTVTSLKAEKEKSFGEVIRLRDALKAAEETNATLAVKVKDTEIQVTSLLSDMVQKQQVSGLELAARKSTALELEQQIQSLLIKTSALEEELKELKHSETATKASLTQTEAQHNILQEKLRDAEANNESYLSQLTTILNDKSSLQEQLQDCESKVATLTSQVSSQDDSRSQDKVNIEQLTKKLDLAEQNAVALQEQVSNAESSASHLGSELELSKRTAEELITQLATARNEHTDTLSRLNAAQASLSALTSSMDNLKGDLTTANDALAKSEAAAAEFRENLDATADKLKYEEGRNQGLIEEIHRKDRDLAQLASNLSTAETLASKHQAEVATNASTIGDLRSQITAAQNEISALQTLQMVTQACYKQEAEEKTSVISGLEESLQGTKSEIEALQASLSSERSESTALQAQMRNQSDELMEAKATIDAERQRVENLEAELALSNTRVQEVEDELVELKSSKEEDESTIENLKNMFTSLRESQMRSLAELDSKVISTKSSPAPQRRSTRSTAAKPPPRFKLI